MEYELTPKQIRWGYEKWCEGYTLIQVGDALKVNERTVRRAFKRNGLVRIRPVLIAPKEIIYDRETAEND